jgi:hypothetical protein
MEGEGNMQRRMIIMATSAALVATAGLAQAQPTTGSTTTSRPGYVSTTRTVTAKATVTAIDMATREVTLRRADGTTFVIVAGEEVRNLPQVRVGDTVEIDYIDALALELKKGGTGLPASRSDVTSAARAELGARPGGAVVKETKIVADVVAVDAAAQAVALRGPRGNVVVLPVRDPEQFRRIAVGDQIEAVYAEAVAVSVRPVAAPATAAAPPPPPARKPFSAYVFLWAPYVNSNMTLPDPRTGNPIDVSVDMTPGDIFRNLDMGFMLYGDWTQDRWSIFGDYTYTRLSPDKDLAHAPGYANIGTVIKMQFGDIAAGYTVWGDRSNAVQLMGGARFFDVKNTVTLNLPGVGTSFERGASDSWVDGFGGLRARGQLAPRWVGVAQIDVGAGGSEYSWQAWGYVGYEFSWGQVGGGWRYLDFKRNQDNASMRMSFNGPMFGVVAKF